MAVFNRIICPHCKKRHNVYDDNLKSIKCGSCNGIISIKNCDKNFFIEYYASGKRKREKIGSSRSLAETVLSKRKVEVAEGKHLDIKKQEKIKFEIFADEYFKLHSQVNNKSWFKSDRINIRILKRSFSGLALTDITPLLIERFKADRAKNVSLATVNRNLACLKTIFNKAIAWGRFSGDNPVRLVKLFKENNQRVRFLEKDEIVRVLSFCNNYLKPIVVIALNTGMRKGEILNLKWSDIDLRRGIIYLHNTKNGEKREIPVNEQVKTSLIRVKKHPQSAYVFFKKDGSPIGDIKKTFFTVLKKSGITNFHFHDLRHTFASHLVMSGVDLNTVRELMGHKSIGMTLRYSHLSPNHKQRAVDVLSKRMDTIWTPSPNFENSVNV